VVQGVTLATTILVIASAGIKALSDPVGTMNFVLNITKGTFANVLQSIGIITEPDQVTSPTVAMVFIAAVAFGSISFALAQKFFSHYAPIRSVIPQAIPESNAAIPESNIPTLKKEDILELIKDNNSLPELINNVTYLQYLLLTLVNDIRKNVKHFDEESKNILDQIQTAAIRLAVDVKPLRPIEMLQFDPAPVFDMEKTKSRVIAMLNKDNPTIRNRSSSVDEEISARRPGAEFAIPKIPSSSPRKEGGAKIILKAIPKPKEELTPSIMR
jgi:hypothetical protein